MARFYGYESALQGFAMLRRVLNDSDWPLAAHFPLVAHCDLRVRQFGSDRTLTVQCAPRCASLRAAANMPATSRSSFQTACRTNTFLRRIHITNQTTLQQNSSRSLRWLTSGTVSSRTRTSRTRKT